MTFENIKVSNDTRTIKKGEYYVPYKGENFDGNKFIDQALKAGAKGIIKETDLYELVKQKLKAYNPTIIGITGSVGKTTTKDALYTILSEKYNVYASIENRNTLLGLSLDIINNLSAQHEIILAEMGMDRLGEIANTTRIIHPEIAIITNIHENHLEKLGSIENIIKAKSEILEAQTNNDNAYLNIDNENVLKAKNNLKAKLHTYSINDKNAKWYLEKDISDNIVKSNLIYKNQTKFGKINTNLLGEHYLYTILLGVAIGDSLKLTIDEMQKGVSKIKGTPGRQHLLEGIKGCTIIDDSYNSSLESAIKLIDITFEIGKTNKVLILGDMLELGTYEEEAHDKLLQYALKKNPKYIVLVGKRLKKAVSKINNKIIDNIVYFDTSDQGAKQLLDIITVDNNTVIGIKGSRGIQTEKFLETLI